MKNFIRLAFPALFLTLCSNAYAVEAWSEKFTVRLVESSLHSKQITVWPTGGSVPVVSGACPARTYFRFNEDSSSVGYDEMVAQLMIAASSNKQIRFYGECIDNNTQHKVRVIQVFHD